MKHVGDITKLNGAELEPVDVITGGSPCQDLSVAGKRAGLDGARSGLFMEQIRIIKEMREHDKASGRADEYIRPRYMVWENVTGTFSSNGGEDFRCVLEETARIVEPSASIPRPDGKWTPSGCIMGDGWSIAWRVHDAQFWGVPQRRKRIALVADFGGGCATEILFIRKGLSGDFGKSKQTREEHTETIRGRSEMSVYDGSRRHSYKEFRTVSETVQTFYGTGGNNQPLVVFRKTKHPRNAEMAQGYEVANVADTINGFDNTDVRSPMLIANRQNDPQSNMCVRRLTPLECERLQGFPDGWTDLGEWVDTKGKKHKEADSPRYKALGNSIALPFWFWLLRRISAQYERTATLGSLFDGIGGFPLCWERCNGKGSARWASEIEEFPIAVTKKHFHEEE